MHASSPRRVLAVLALCLATASVGGFALEGRIAVALKSGALHVHGPDGSSLAVVPTGPGPRSIVLHDGRLFVAERGVGDRPGSTMTVIDAASLAVQRTARVCAGCAPRDIAFDRAGTLWFSGQAHHAVYWAGPPWEAPDGSVVVGRAWPSALSMSDDGARLAVGFRDGGDVVLIDTQARTLSRIPATKSPAFVAARPGAREFWVASDIDGALVRIVLALDGTATKPEVVRPQAFAGGLAFLPGGRQAVMTDVARQRVLVLDAATGSVEGQVELDSQPGLVAVAPSGTAVAVVAGDGDRIRLFTIGADGSLAAAGEFATEGTVSALRWIP